MSSPKLDRNDPKVAERIMLEICPSGAGRRLVLAQLLRSIGIAEEFSTESWAARAEGWRSQWNHYAYRAKAVTPLYTPAIFNFHELRLGLLSEGETLIDAQRARSQRIAALNSTTPTSPQLFAARRTESANDPPIGCFACSANGNLLLRNIESSFGQPTRSNHARGSATIK